VITRIATKGLKLICERCNITSGPGQAYNTFHGSDLPRWGVDNGLWVPTDSDFPAIDFFIKSGSVVAGFQVHVGAHHNVAPDFFFKCESAGWIGSNSPETSAQTTERVVRSTSKRTILLVYLSPNDAAKDEVKDHVKGKFYSPPKDGASVVGAKRLRADDPTMPHNQGISLVSLTCRQISSLEALSFR
jgi:hypothetical protein